MQKIQVTNNDTKYDTYDGGEVLDAGKTFCLAINKFAYKFTEEDAAFILADLQNFFKIPRIAT